MEKSLKLYIRLFISTFQLSAFTFGGGYVIVPLMREKFVEQFHWLEEQEMLNLTAIAQAAPGAIAVNASILVGYRLAGVGGAFVCIIGTVLPPLVLLSAISFFYQAFKESTMVNAVLKGMNAGVAAVVADVSVSMSREIAKQREVFSTLLMVLAFVAVFVFDVDVKIILLAGGMLGLVAALIQRRKNTSRQERKP